MDPARTSEILSVVDRIHRRMDFRFPPMRFEDFLACFDALVTGYLPEKSLEDRAAALLPALLLARVDGKSPVEYLGAADQAHVRQVARPLVASPPQRLMDVREAWQRSLT